MILILNDGLWMIILHHPRQLNQSVPLSPSEHEQSSMLSGQVTLDRCTNWFLRIDHDSIPAASDIPSLWAGITKPGDILYTPPGMIIVDKIVNEDSVCVCQP